MFDLTVLKLAEHKRAKKVVGICKSNLKKKISEKRSAEVSNGIQRFRVL